MGKQSRSKRRNGSCSRVARTGFIDRRVQVMAKGSEDRTHASLGQGEKHEEEESVAWRQRSLPKLCQRVGTRSQRGNASCRAKKEKGRLPFAKVATGSRPSLKSNLVRSPRSILPQQSFNFTR